MDIDQVIGHEFSPETKATIKMVVNFLTMYVLLNVILQGVFAGLAYFFGASVALTVFNVVGIIMLALASWQLTIWVVQWGVQQWMLKQAFKPAQGPATVH